MNIKCTKKNFTNINVISGFAGFPVLLMYFSRHIVPAFKSRDLIECVCNGERRQTLLCVCDSLKVTTNKKNKTDKYADD